MRQPLRIAGIVIAFLAVAWLIAELIRIVGFHGFGEWRLVFQQWDAPDSFWGTILLCAAAVALIAWLFQYEQRLISRELGLTLLGLRMLLVLVLFLTLLQPVWTWSFDRTRTGRVVVALDVSESMDTIDSQATDAEKLRWAQAIGLVGAADDAERTRGWIAALEAGRQPEWAAADEVPDPQRRQRLAQARRENVETTIRNAATASRLELARRALAQGGHAVRDRLRELAVLQVAAFARNHHSLEFTQLDQPLDAKSLSVDRSHTDLVEAAAAARLGDPDVPLAGVVILSDGRNTDRIEASRLLAVLQGLGAPIHTVLVGSEHRPRDVSILYVDHPASVFVDDQPLVKAMVQTIGFDGKPFKVHLEWLDDSNHVPLEQTVAPHGATAEVSFALGQLDVGLHRFRIRADVLPNETREDNNSRDFAVEVVDDRAKALLVDGEGRWEFRFLDDALTRDERVTTDHVLFDQPFLGVLRKPFFPTRLEDVAVAVGDQTPFAGYDVVIIGDVSPQHLTTAQWQQLERYVREEGGTLVLTAGKQHFPFEFSGTLAESLLPIEDLRVVRPPAADQVRPPAERGFRLFVTADGERLPMFQLDADPDASRSIWAQLPGHAWGVVGRAKGGATVWAAALMPGERPQLERERQNALIAQHYVGSGQVVWIGIDSTWRWRYRVGDLYHHRFWGQLVRSAIAFKAGAGNALVRFGVREPLIDVGQPAIVQARWDERFLAQHPDLKAQAIVERSGGGERASQSIELVPRQGNPLIYEGQAVNLPAGEYSVALNVAGADVGMDVPSVVLIVNEESTPELRDVSVNRPLLEQIARETGGEFLQLNELDRLPNLFRDVTATEMVREEVPAYSHWLVLAVFSSVAMAEWVLRKINGLP